MSKSTFCCLETLQKREKRKTWICNAVFQSEFIKGRRLGNVASSLLKNKSPLNLFLFCLCLFLCRVSYYVNISSVLFLLHLISASRMFLSHCFHSDTFQWFGPVRVDLLFIEGIYYLNCLGMPLNCDTHTLLSWLKSIQISLSIFFPPSYLCILSDLMQFSLCVWQL